MRALIMIVLSLLAVCGCKSDTEKQFEREQTIIQLPLEHDPTNRVELARWWTNEEQLLRLDGDAAYTLFEGLNRFDHPIERGRWSKTSYAVLWLEPYNTRNVEPRRVSITKIDGRLSLLIPDRKPMFALPDGPPPVLEDRMVGEWTGPIGSLQLSNDLRFALDAALNDSGDVAVPQIRALHRGGWHIADNQLVLNSDIPGIDPLVMPLVVDDSQVTITAPGGAMTKVEVPAAAEPSS